MKKLATLLIAAGLVFGASTGASAIDFKAKGSWLMSFDYGKNGKFTGGNGITGYGNGEDQFEASQRVRLQLDAVASEALSGTLYFEIGKTFWGQAKEGGALGADGKTIKVRRAYIDWMPPETDLKVRMGLIGLGLPNYTMGKSQVFEDDVAAVTLSYQFNENVGLTAFWARPYNDNYTDPYVVDAAGDRHYLSTGKIAGFMDNVDIGGLILPLTFDGFKITPYALIAGVGPNAMAMTWIKGNDKNGDPYSFSGLNGAPATSANQTYTGMLPAWGICGSDGRKVLDVMKDKYGVAWWAGFGADITYWDPFRVAFDFAYGSYDSGNHRFSRAGWGASLLLEYKMDWGIPGLVGWYYSGDNGDLGDGSERLPYVSVGNGDNQFSRFAFDGNPYIAREGVIGSSMAGTWGVGLRIRDFSFLEDLKHTFRINYIGGTNSPKVLKKVWQASQINPRITRPAANNGGDGVDNMYLTRLDSALEFGFNTEYKMYENFTVAFDASYIALWLDNSSKTWKGTPMNGLSRDVRDAWNLNVTFAYEF